MAEVRRRTSASTGAEIDLVSQNAITKSFDMLEAVRLESSLPEARTTQFFFFLRSV